MEGHITHLFDLNVFVSKKTTQGRAERYCKKYDHDNLFRIDQHQFFLP